MTGMPVHHDDNNLLRNKEQNDCEINSIFQGNGSGESKLSYHVQREYDSRKRRSCLWYETTWSHVLTINLTVVQFRLTGDCLVGKHITWLTHDGGDSIIHKVIHVVLLLAKVAEGTAGGPVAVSVKLLPKASIPPGVLGCNIVTLVMRTPSTAVSASKASPSPKVSQSLTSLMMGKYPDWSRRWWRCQDEQWLLFCDCRWCRMYFWHFVEVHFCVL